MTRENKILQLIQRLTENSKWFEDVFKSNDEYYFKYKGHVFSILQRNYENDAKWGEYGFYIYPGYQGYLLDLAESFAHGAEPEYTHFDVKDYNEDCEAMPIFARLYQTFQTRAVDSVIDDILGYE